MIPTSPRAKGSLSARVLCRMLDFVGARGHDVGAMCRAVGVDASSLREPSARVSYAVAERLCERALEVTGDERFGLHLARGVGAAMTDDAGTLMLMACPTARAALEAMVRVQRYWGDGPRSEMAPVEGGVALRYALPGATGALRRHGDECALAEVLLGLRAVLRREVTPRAVRFRHEAPRDVGEHEALFGCRVEFGAAHSELVLDDAVLDLALPDAHPTYRAVFESQVERALSTMPGEQATTDAVRDVAGSMLAGGCTLASVARSLGTSARTLQRRLRDEGATFEGVVDGLRREAALSLLARGTAPGEVALRLGYAAPSAFHHAVKRWTGRTPSQLRGA